MTPQYHHPILCCCALGTLLAGGTGSADDFPVVTNSPSEAALSPMDARQSAAEMIVPEGFRVSVFAQEPEVQNPVAMAWDDAGRLWIAENYTYSDRSQRFDLSLRDRVLIFSDTNHDGVADERMVFTDQVQMLTSVEVGHGGVWLMCPPQLLFIPDGNADGIPDGPAEVVLDGFTVAQDNYHNFANGLRWGPDGWLYGRCGHSCPGVPGIPGTPEELRVPLDGGIWRFHPQRQTVEVLCHGTVNPWGHDWDEHGELFFINTVIGHAWHVMPGAHFRESFGESLNPAVYERIDTIADHYHFDREGRGGIGRNGDADAWGGGHAHIGMMICHSDVWPTQYRGRLFTLNMHGRRLNRDRLERQGAGFVARHEPDFLLAPDPFFRAIEITQGPDGNAFLIDWSDTGECHEHDGIHRTSGRIYKVSYGDPAPPGPMVKPWCARGDGRLQELWRAYRSGRTTPEMLHSLLRDPNEHLRVWAIRLLTDFWPLDTITGPRPDAVYPDDPVARAEFIRMAADDDSGLVLLVLASTLQRLPVDQRASLAVELVRHKRYASDRDLPALVWYGLIPLAQQDPQEAVRVAAACRWPTTLKWISRHLAGQVESTPAALDALLTSAIAFSPELQDAVVQGLSDAWAGWRRASQPAAWTAFASAPVSARNREQIRRLNLLFGDGQALDEIRRVAMDSTADMSTRQRALQTIIDARPSNLRPLCESLLSIRLLNAVAARGLAEFDDPDAGRLLARSYRRFHPDDRAGVIGILSSRPVYARALLEEIDRENGSIEASDISAFAARQILGLNDPDVTRRLREVWGELRDPGDEAVRRMHELRAELTADALAAADLSAGRQLFVRTCSQCHRLYGQGHGIAPDLTGSQRYNVDYLLQNLLDPSATVGSNYRMSVLALKNGQVLNGLIVSRNDKAVMLQTATEQLTLAVEDIETTRETALSAMPDGLLNSLAPGQIRDLLAYLMHPTQVPLPVAADETGANR